MGDSTPEVKLAAAILAQAFSDMIATATDSTFRSAETAETAAVSAIRFLTDRAGTSAQWRNLWCAAINLDGDRLAARVRRLLDGEIEPTAEMRGRAHISAFDKGIARARERWARIKPAAPTAPKASSSRPPTIKRSAPLRPAPTPPAPRRIEPEDVVVTVVDDPLFVSSSGHLRASRQWNDGETSRFLGPLPSLRTPVGQALWTVTQSSRAGLNSLTFLAKDPHAFVETLRAALPNVEIDWTVKGQRLSKYQPNAGLRLYLKQLAKAA
jgi:hypothetical protein